MSDHAWKLWYSHHSREREDIRSRSLRFVAKVWHALGLTHVAIILALVAYALLGGLIFYSIEGPAEEVRQSQLTMQMDKRRHEISKKMIEYISNCSSDPSSKVCSLGMEDLIEWYEKETEPLRMAQPGLYNWSNFWNAVWYASTVFTTIGYGNLACKTFAGQLMTIIYALIGIPLTLVVLNDIGQLLFRKLTLAYVFFLRKKASWKGEESKELPKEINLPLWIAVAIILVYALVCGGLIAIAEENWTYFDGMYFMFVSVCTIGFGDVMPSDPHDTLKMGIVFLIGLSLISLCFSIMNVSMEQRYRETMINLEETIERDDKDTSTAQFQSMIFGNRREIHAEKNEEPQGEDKEIEEIAANSYPGIALGVFDSRMRSRSPSLRVPRS
uniref:Potassium channel domain-containing protein n=1 Tax=Plectus sambesii TaxID=2011161 RepID=A0A914XIE7_9BILA